MTPIYPDLPRTTPRAARNFAATNAQLVAMQVLAAATQLPDQHLAAGSDAARGAARVAARVAAACGAASAASGVATAARLPFPQHTARLVVPSLSL